MSTKNTPEKPEKKPRATELLLSPINNTQLSHLCGALDENLRQIETALDVSISRRGERFTIRGDVLQMARASEALQTFYARAKNPLSVDEIQLGLVELVTRHPRKDLATGGISPALVTRKADLHGRTPRQIEYLKNIQEYDITFGVGPAGTGKTYLAVASAVDAFERELVQRIVLTRPAVEAGERLGFLPGDLAQKIDPYLRPLYDALYDLMGFDKVARLFEKNAIEIAHYFELSEKLIGLTILAAGTSLPELATSAVAAYRKNTDIAIGNVVGSNIFNILFILSVSGLISPIAFNPNFNAELLLLIGGTLLLTIFMFTSKKMKIDRWEGAVLLGIFIAYTIYLINKDL